MLKRNYHAISQLRTKSLLVQNKASNKSYPEMHGTVLLQRRFLLDLLASSFRPFVVMSLAMGVFYILPNDHDESLNSASLRTRLSVTTTLVLAISLT